MKIATIVKRLKRIKSDMARSYPRTCRRKKKSDSCDYRNCIYCVKNSTESAIQDLLNNIAGKKNESPEVTLRRSKARLRKLIQERDKK